MSTALDSVQALIKALEAGNTDAAPSTLVQGAALQIEDLSAVMNNVTYEQKHIKIQKDLQVDSCKSTLAQFDRQLSYGQFGGSAQLEGNVGVENTSDFVRITVPMAYYSEVRRATIVANMVATVDGKKADERCAADAAMRLAGDIEFDIARGLSDFSNAGVFDGNPLVVPALPNMHGIDLQIRQSDTMANAKDQMFAEYGSDDSVVLSVGGALTQTKVEDAATRSALAFGTADVLLVDPIALSSYNKIGYNKERIILAGSPQEAQGVSLHKQWTSGGTVSVEASNFLRGKAKPAKAKVGAPGAPGTPTSNDVTTDAGSAFLATDKFYYVTTAVNEIGESLPSPASAQLNPVQNGDMIKINVVYGSGTVRYYNVYRSAAGGAATATRFIGRVLANGSSNVTFTDLGNKSPGFVTGLLLQKDTMVIKELSPYSRLKLAVTDLSQPEAHFRFCSLAVTQPRKNVILDNITGTFTASPTTTYVS